MLPPLKRGATYAIDGQRLIYECSLGHGMLKFIDPDTHGPFQLREGTGYKFPTEDWLLDVMSRGLVELVRDLSGLRPAIALATKEELDRAEIIKLDPAAAIRQHYLRAYDASPVGRGRKSMRAFIEANKPDPKEVGPYKLPGASTVCSWIVKRGAFENRHIRLMRSMTGQKKARRSRFENLVLDAVRQEAAWYWSDKTHQMQEAQARARTRLQRLKAWRAKRIKAGLTRKPPLKTPCNETIRGGINRYENFDTVLAKYGPEEAKRRFQPSGEPTLSATRILELGVLDHHTFDAWAVWDDEKNVPCGRPTLCALGDVHSRCISGTYLTFESPSLDTATETLIACNRPKTHLARRFPDRPHLAVIYGLFGRICVDNAWETTGSSWRDSLREIGTDVTWAPIYEPQYKGIIESFFGTLQSLLEHKLPGGVPFPADVMRKLGWDPKKDCVIYLSKLRELLDEALSLYHYSHHSAHDGLFPIQVWEKSAKRGFNWYENEREFTTMFGTTDECRLTKDGVVLECQRFNSHEPRIAKRLGEVLAWIAARRPMRFRPKGSATGKVKVKWRKTDLGEIHIFDPRPEYLEYFTVPNVRPERCGVSLEQYKLVRHWAREEAIPCFTDEQWDAALLALRESINRASPARTTRAARKQRRLLGSSLARRPATVANVEPHHDGMAVAVAVSATTKDRKDGGTKLKGRRRGRVSTQVQGSPKGKPTSTAAPNSMPANDTEPPTRSAADRRRIADALDPKDW